MGVKEGLEVSVKHGAGLLEPGGLSGLEVRMELPKRNHPDVVRSKQ